MKVKDLKIGMMLKPDVSNRYFVTRTEGWLSLSDPPSRKRSLRWNNMHLVTHPQDKDVALYLGTRADIGGHKVKWSDHFVLFQNKVIAVDPYTWRYISPVE